MFGDKNHIHAIATVIGTLGGFQQAPDWFQNLSTSSVWQTLMAAILIFQGGGDLDFGYSLVVAIAFRVVMYLSNYIKLTPIKLIPAKATQPTEEEAENFLSKF